MRMRIAELRERQEMSQEALGEKVGLTGASISRIETGIQSKTFDRLPKIAEALGVTVPELFDLGPHEREIAELIGIIRRIHPADRSAAARILRGLADDQGQPPAA